MASISVPCPKTVMVAGAVTCSAQIPQQKQRISFPVEAFHPKPSLVFGSALTGFQVPNRKQSTIFKVQAALNDVNAASNSAPTVDTNSKISSTDEKDETAGSNIPDVSSIEAFMTQVSGLVELVDSRDITELYLKQSDCELIIKKKEAFQPPPAPAPAPVVHMQTPYQQAVAPPSVPSPAPSAAPSPAPPALPAPSPSPAQSSSHPPMNCPMAGTFYRSPAPGAPPFAKVGDKVQKGQVICIVEAMKLMNEIESDRAGTITDILVEDGKPVSVGMPLFVIAP